MAILLSLASPPDAHAQGQPFSWQPVDPADLALKDSLGAHAMFLDLEEVVDDPDRLQTIHARIKVFDDEGKKYGDFELPYQEKESEIVNIHARTLNPDGSVLEFQGQVFDQLVVKSKKLQYRAKIFTLPDVQAGSIIEYSYQVHWRQDAPPWLRDPGKATEFLVLGITLSFRTATWELQRDLFVRHAHYLLKPYPKARLGWSMLHLRPGEKPQVNQDHSVELDVKNIPALQKEELMPPESTLWMRVDFFYMVGSYSSETYFWDQVGRLQGNRVEEFLSKHKRADRIAAETAAASDPPEIKLRKLYARAQQFRNLSHEHERTEKELKHEHINAENKTVDDIVEHGYGWGNEINYLFVALARAAGFNARYVLVTGRDTGIFRMAVPDQKQLNAGIAFVHAGERDFYLDPAEHLCPFPLLPWYEAGASGIRLEGSGILMTTPPPVSADSVVTRNAFLRVSDDGALQGKLEVAFTGQLAFVRRKEMADEDAAGRRKSLEEDGRKWLPPGATVELTKSEGWDDASVPLRAEFTVTIPNQTVRTATRLFVPVAVTVGGKLNPFQHTYREQDVDLRFPYREKDEVTIELPAGYEVEALPAARKRAGPSASYELSATRQGNTLVARRKLEMDSSYYTVMAYPALHTFFSTVKTGDQDRAVLRQVSHAAQH